MIRHCNFMQGTISLVALGTIVAVIAVTEASSAATIFGTPVNLGPGVNSAYKEGGPSVSSDGLTIYFQSNRPGGQGTGSSIWKATRPSVDVPFGSPTVVPELLSDYHDFAPIISANGLSLYFTSTRASPNAQGDVFVSTRSAVGAPWGTPMIIAEVNSVADDGATGVSPDELTIYLTSLRSGGSGEYDIWVATRASTIDPFGAPVNLGPSINSADIDGNASATGDGLTLYFASTRRGGQGDRSIWRSTRVLTSDPWGAPLNLPAGVNSDFVEGGSRISPDGQTLWFVSTRAGGFGDSDIYMASVIPEPSALVLALVGYGVVLSRRRS